MDRASFSIAGVSCHNAYLSIELPYYACGNAPAADCRAGRRLDYEAMRPLGNIDLVDLLDSHELLDRGVDGCAPLRVDQVESA